MNVWQESLDGGNRKQITFDCEAMSYPDWSKDGKWLAVEIKRGDATHVGVVSRDGGMVEQLTSADGQSWPGSWAPDNDRVVFGGERNGVWNIYTVSKHTKRVAQLTHFTSLDGFAWYPSWSPTGRRIVFERAVYQGSLWTFKRPLGGPPLVMAGLENGQRVTSRWPAC